MRVRLTNGWTWTDEDCRSRYHIGAVDDARGNNVDPWQGASIVRGLLHGIDDLAARERVSRWCDQDMCAPPHPVGRK